MNKLIDLDRVIKTKNPKLHKWMPGFLLSYIKRIVHQDDLNAHMIKHKDKKDVEFCKASIKDFGVKVTSKGLENIPKEGGFLFVGNHPIGGFDALAIAQEVHEIRPDIKFIVNDLLLHVDNLKTMFHGVNKHGKTARKSIKKVAELFESDNAVFVFPAGLVSRKKKGVIRDLEWQKTFVSQAKKNKKMVVPVYTEGKLSNFFYRLANLREFLGIKSNIEMMYLSNEMYKQRGQTISVIFGEPIPYETFDKSKSDKKWAEWVKDKVYSLKE